MAVFIEARTEPFEQQREDLANSLWSGARTTQPVRRPTRGHQLKEDTYCVIRIRDSNGQFIPVIDAAGETYLERNGWGYTTHYTNFFVQSIAEERHEKQQVVSTFGDDYIFFFGEAPRMLQVQGLLLNSADFNWKSEFWANYNRYFRGTKLVERGARLYLIYDDVIVEGYMVAASATQNTDTPALTPFNFQIFVTGETDISFLGDPDFPAPNDLDYTQLSSYEEALKIWQNNRNLQRELSTKAVLEANRRAFPGSGNMLSDFLRVGISFGGDAGVAGFLGRASAALNITATISIGSSSGRTVNPLAANQAIEPTRSAPLRGQFTDNIDEFIGGPQAEPTAKELASPLSMADKWLKMDRAVDNGIKSAVPSFSVTVSAFSDLMGRQGRAAVEIKSKGGHRARRPRLSRGVTVGDNAQPRPPRGPRVVPFGITSASGTME